MKQIHVIKDESLGGIEREYVEVDREAVVGDYVVIIGNEMGHLHEIGAIVKVDKVDEGVYADGWWISDEVDKDYLTLEPSGIVHIDGARYHMVERKAEVGEKVLIVKGSGWYENEVGGVYKVINGSDFGRTSHEECHCVNHPSNCDAVVYLIAHEEYRVLEPVADELLTGDEEIVGVDYSQASPEVIDLLANLASRLTTLEQSLARRVTSLEKKLGSVESQLKDTQANVERQAEELANSIRIAIDHHKELNEKVEMVLDDIVTLDERTQPKNAESVFVKALVELAKEVRQ